jgi:hypothetical protein
VSDQQELRDALRSGGPRIIENIDLSSQQVHEQIAANDLWVNGTTSWHTKVDRADKHIRELEEVIKEYFSAANPSILWTFDDAVDHWEARLQLPFDLPAEVGVIVGDILHG